jgi:hypothetical protein
MVDAGMKAAEIIDWLETARRDFADYGAHLAV